MMRYLLVFLAGISLHAEMLTQSYCIERALSTHPDVKRTLLQVKQSRSGVDAADADYLPQVTLNAEYDPLRTYVLPVNGQFHTKDEDGWSVVGAVKQKLWDFDKTFAVIDSAKSAEKIAQLTLAEAKALMTYRVKSLYALMVVQREAVTVRRKDMEAKKALYDQALALVKQGLKTKADASRFLSAYYLAKDNLAVSKAAFEKARAALSLLIGEPVAGNVALQDDVLDADDATVLSDENATEARMLAHNPQLRSYEESVRKNSLQYRSVKSSHYGSIDAVGSYVHQDTLNRYDASVVGVVATIPLYTGGRISAEAQQARIGTAMAQEAYASKRLALRQELEERLIDLRRLEKTIEARQAQLASAEAARKLLEARYKEGLSTYIEVLDAAAQALDAKLGLLEARYTRSDALNRIDYLIGHYPEGITE
jgi:outer membrane protein TolC